MDTEVCLFLFSLDVRRALLLYKESSLARFEVLKNAIFEARCVYHSGPGLA